MVRKARLVKTYAIGLAQVPFDSTDVTSGALLVTSGGKMRMVHGR